MARISVARELEHWKGIRDLYEYGTCDEDLFEVQRELSDYVQCISHADLASDNFPISHRVYMRRMQEVLEHTIQAGEEMCYDLDERDAMFQDAVDNYLRFKRLQEEGVRIVEQPC